jgi:hypothetical protein
MHINAALMGQRITMTKADGQQATGIVVEVTPDTLFVKGNNPYGFRVGFHINTITKIEPTAESTPTIS